MSVRHVAVSVQPGHAVGFETQQEELAGVALTVEGTLPDWVGGRLPRTGPGQFPAGETELRHWFDAYAMLRGFRIDGRANTVTYTNRFVRSEDFRYAREEGGVRRMLPGTPPDRPAWTRLRHSLTGAFQDNPSIGVVNVGGSITAITESPTGIRVDAETLETTGRRDLTTGLEADFTLGHPHYDPGRETFVNLAVSYGRGVTYTLFERDPQTTKPTVIGRVSLDDASYVHSFALTDEFAVVPAIPFGLDTTTLVTGALGDGTFLDAVTNFEDGIGGTTSTRDGSFLLLDRETGEVVREVPADPFFVYHHANAFRDGDEVVVDLIAYEDERAMTKLTVDELASPDPGVPQGDFVRYRLPLEEGRATRETLYEGQVEFPTVDYPAKLGEQYRYCYLAANDDGSSLPTRLVKYDLHDRSTTEWEPDGTAFPGEPLFERAPGADEEDVGVIVTTVLDADADRTELVVLDARELQPVARAPCPHRLPFGFHGQFYRDGNRVRSMA